MRGLVEYIKYLEEVRNSLEQKHAATDEIDIKSDKEKYRQQVNQLKNENPWNITWNEILEGSQKP
jgi:hypothetical protein